MSRSKSKDGQIVPVNLKRIPRKRQKSPVEQAVDDVTSVVNGAAEVLRAAKKVYRDHIEPHVKRIKGGK